MAQTSSMYICDLAHLRRSCSCKDCGYTHYCGSKICAQPRENLRLASANEYLDLFNAVLERSADVDSVVCQEAVASPPPSGEPFLQGEFVVSIVRLAATAAAAAFALCSHASRSLDALPPLPLLPRVSPALVTVVHHLARDQRVPKAGMRIAQHEQRVARVEQRRQEAATAAQVQEEDGGLGELARPPACISTVHLVHLPEHGEGQGHDLEVGHDVAGNEAEQQRQHEENVEEHEDQHVPLPAAVQEQQAHEDDVLGH